MENPFVYSDCSLDLTAQEAEIVSFALAHTCLQLEQNYHESWIKEIALMKSIRFKLHNIMKG